MTSQYEVRQVTPRVALILAPNPSAWTLDGTNTWSVGSPDSQERAVIDPGPIDEAHLQRNVCRRSGRVNRRDGLRSPSAGRADPDR